MVDRRHEVPRPSTPPPDPAHADWRCPTCGEPPREGTTEHRECPNGHQWPTTPDPVRCRAALTGSAPCDTDTPPDAVLVLVHGTADPIPGCVTHTAVMLAADQHAVAMPGSVPPAWRKAIARARTITENRAITAAQAAASLRAAEVTP